jgi:hypothetical protein
VPSLKARGEIVGHVLDERAEPIQYAAIILVGTRTGAMSGERGEFKLLGIAPGAYDINVMMLGHHTQYLRIEVKPSNRTRVTVRMKYNFRRRTGP